MFPLVRLRCSSLIREAGQRIATDRQRVVGLGERLAGLLELAGAEADRLRLFEPEPEPWPA